MEVLLFGRGRMKSKKVIFLDGPAFEENKDSYMLIAHNQWKIYFQEVERLTIVRKHDILPSAIVPMTPVIHEYEIGLIASGYPKGEGENIFGARWV